MIQRRFGFSLLELSVVMVVLSLIAGFGINMGAGALKAADRVTTQERLNTIKIALDSFAKTNGYLPCPADRQWRLTDANFGVEVRVGTYTGSLSGNPVCGNSGTSLVQVGASAGRVFIGGIPTRTLGLPDAYAGDAWGSKFTYAVSAPHTADILSYYRNDTAGNGTGQISIRYGDRSGTNYSLTTITQNTGDPASTTLLPSISSLTPGTPTHAATYAVVSHGRDRRGAFPLNGSAVPVGRYCIATTDNTSPMPCNTNASKNLCNDIENCSDAVPTMDASETTGGTVFYDTAFNDGDNAAQYFDDYIVWGTNTQMRAPIQYDYYEGTGECGAGTACNLWCAECENPYPRNIAHTPSSATFTTPILCHKFITTVYGFSGSCRAQCSWGGVREDSTPDIYTVCP